MRRLIAPGRAVLGRIANTLDHRKALRGAPLSTGPGPEFHERFPDKRAFNAWRSSVPEAEVSTEILLHVRRNGLVEPLTGRRFAPSHIRMDLRNLRESVVAGGVNARMRALLACLEVVCGTRRDQRVLAPEAVTPLARLLRKEFPSFRGTEYLPDETSRRARPGIEHLDIQDMPYSAGAFDLFVSAEVMEHIPWPERAVGEIARVLAPGGTVVSTFPFRIDQDTTEVKAEIAHDGTVVHRTRPEYHGNPVDPAGGSLVFTIPGWDVLDLYRSHGFTEVAMHGLASARHGILSQGTPLVVVLVAKRDNA